MYYNKSQVKKKKQWISGSRFLKRQKCLISATWIWELELEVSQTAESGLTHIFLLRIRIVTVFAEFAAAASGITLATRVDDTVGLAAFPWLLQKWSNVILAQTVT